MKRPRLARTVLCGEPGESHRANRLCVGGDVAELVGLPIARGAVALDRQAVDDPASLARLPVDLLTGELLDDGSGVALAQTVTSEPERLDGGGAEREHDVVVHVAELEPRVVHHDLAEALVQLVDVATRDRPREQHPAAVQPLHHVERTVIAPDDVSLGVELAEHAVEAELVLLPDVAGGVREHLLDLRQLGVDLVQLALDHHVAPEQLLRRQLDVRPTVETEGVRQHLAPGLEHFCLFSLGGMCIASSITFCND